MPISSLLSFKLIFISTSLLSAAVALKLSAPAIADFAVTEVPTIYNGVVSWLRPPYLYLVINCIIITIVASSKLQSKLEYPAPPPPPLVPVAVAPPNGIVFHAPPIPVQQIVPPREFFDDGRNGVVFSEAVGIPVVAPPPESVDFRFIDLNRFEDVKSTPEPVEYEYGDNFNSLDRFEAVKSSPDFEYGENFNGLNRFEAVKSSLETVNFEFGDRFNGLNRFEDVKSLPDSVTVEYDDSFNRFEDVKSSPDSVNVEYDDSFNRFEDVKSSPEMEIGIASVDITTAEAIPPEMEIDVSKDEFSVSKSSWSPPVISRKKEWAELPVSSQKPPVASRFGHRRSIKASPEGGKAVLGVSRSKKQDTLETTWKTITEGRAMPLTRHLRKSDTWEREGHHGGRQQQQEQRMTKSETFNDVSGGAAAGKPLQRAAGGSGKLKKEASLGQDDLNRRVEAFIRKFNEDMRLQRQESLNQYKEMISRGAH